MSYDGVKMARELNRWWTMWKASGATATHAGGSWPNRFVEAARVSAYAAGHIESVVYPALTFLALCGWLLALGLGIYIAVKA